VGQLLQEKTGKKITSINAGVGGNNSLHSLDVLLNKIIPLKPDVVVMMHNINDLVTLIYDKTYWGNNPSRQPIIDFYFYKNLTGLKALSTLARDMYIPNLHASIRLLSHKIFGRKVKVQDDEFANVRGKKLTIDEAAIINEFKMNLQTFINICRAWHITPVLMTQFNRYKRHPDPKVLAAMLVVPLLTVYADFFAILGGMIVGILGLDLTAYTYLKETQRSLSLLDMVTSLIKAGVFAMLIAGIGCQRGFEVRGGAEAVGTATTSAVVAALFLIIVTDSAFALAFHYLGI